MLMKIMNQLHHTKQAPLDDQRKTNLYRVDYAKRVV